MQKLLFIYLFSLCLAINKENIYENSYALIIGIDNYQNVPELDYAVNDAVAVESMLITKFQFEQENALGVSIIRPSQRVQLPISRLNPKITFPSCKTKAASNSLPDLALNPLITSVFPFSINCFT